MSQANLETLYLGEVVVNGLTPDAARAEIQKALEPIAASAQVQLSVEPGVRNAVDLVSGVRSPGTYPLPDRNYSILSLLAQGGGIAPSLKNPLAAANTVFGLARSVVGLNNAL